MIDALFNQTNYVAAKSMLDATVLRQQAIASNIANVETPGFKRLQVAKSCEAEFEQAIASRDLTSIRNRQPKLEVDPTTRRALARYGVRDGQIARRTGFGDTQPIASSDPAGEENRRVTILLRFRSPHDAIQGNSP